MKKIAVAIGLMLVAAAICITADIVFHAPSYGVALPTGSALFETSLQSRISTSDTSMTLVSVSLRGGDTLSGYNCFTIDEGQTNQEYVCGTVSSKTVSSLERGLSFSNGTTTVGILKYSHRVGADVKITDFPLIQRMRDVLNGSSSLPYALSYASEPSFTVGTQIIDKTYADALTFAGAPNANQTTKGIVEIATALEAGSSTATGSTGATLVLPASVATDTPQSCTSVGCVVVSKIGGKISQTWLELSAAFTWTGAQVFQSTATFNGASTFNVAPTFGTFSATSTSATSTVSGNLQVSNNATTTNLFVSTKCTGCSESGRTVVTNTGTGPSTITGTGSVTATCSGSQI